MSRQVKPQEMLPDLVRLLRHFWPYTRKYRLLIFGAVATLIAQVGLRILEPWPLKFVFDRIIPTSPQGSGDIGVLDRLDPTWLLAPVRSLPGGHHRGCDRWQSIGARSVFLWWVTGFSPRSEGNFTDTFNSSPCDFTNGARSGDLVVRLMGDVGLVREVVVTALLPLLANVFILGGMLILMVWLSWKLTLLALLTLPLFWIQTLRLTRRINRVARKQRKHQGSMTAAAVESMGAIETVQALSLQATFAESFSSDDKQIVKQGIKGKRLMARLERTVSLVVALASALVLFFGAREVLRGFMTPGDLLVFLTYLKSAFKPAQNFSKYSGRLAKAMAAGERILEILDEEPGVRDRPQAIPAPSFRGQVTLENIAFEYEPDSLVLRDLSLAVEPGQTVVISGPSGAGKTTLLGLLLRLYDPLDGRVAIDGQDIRDFTVESLRSQISTVLQDNVLFAATVRENLTYGLEEVEEEEVRTAARLGLRRRLYRSSAEWLRHCYRRAWPDAFLRRATAARHRTGRPQKDTHSDPGRTGCRSGRRQPRSCQRSSTTTGRQTDHVPDYSRSPL